MLFFCSKYNKITVKTINAEFFLVVLVVEVNSYSRYVKPGVINIYKQGRS